MYDPTKPYKHDILRQIERTWRTPYVHVRRGIYPIFTKKFSFPEVQHTDGIGTKGFFHWKARTFTAAVEDALAMNLNDLALVGATPYALQKHLTLPKDDSEAIRAILTALANECRARKIAMTGGETSIHAGTDALEISITVSGFVRRARENRLRAGDVLIGLPSNGLHANGLTFARKVLGSRMRVEYVRPTPIYWDAVMRALERFMVHGMMHITGGAFTKLKDIAHGVDVQVAFPKQLHLPPIFKEIAACGISNATMYRTLNCGIGFVLSLPEAQADAACRSLRAVRIGNVVRGSGVVEISSAFDGRTVRY